MPTAFEGCTPAMHTRDRTDDELALTWTQTIGEAPSGLRPRDRFRHCLRALYLLGREDAVRDAVEGLFRDEYEGHINRLQDELEEAHAALEQAKGRCEKLRERIERAERPRGMRLVEGIVRRLLGR